MTVRQLFLFLRLTRPHFLFGGFILFGLGTAIARYLGRPVPLPSYLLGQTLVTLIQMSTHYLNEYYDAPVDEKVENRTPFSGGSGVLGEGGLPRKVALYAGIICLGLAGTTTMATLIVGGIPPLALWILLLSAMGAVWYNVPPLRLVSSGYGEVMASIVISGLTPAFGFALMTGELHRLIPMTTIPLIAINLAMIITFELPDYVADAKFGKETMMVRLGWSTTMRLHDVSLLFAGISFLIAFWMGLPGRVAMGALIAAPLAIAQIWQMRRIRQGFPARWGVLTFGAFALYGVTSYLELVGYLLS